MTYEIKHSEEWSFLKKEIIVANTVSSLLFKKKLQILASMHDWRSLLALRYRTIVPYRTVTQSIHAIGTSTAVRT